MQISGTVISGDGYGRQIGFPTINIDTDDYKVQGLDVKQGIYGGWVKLSETESFHLAGIVIGPLDAQGLPKLEAHLIDYAGDLYGQSVTIYPMEFLRVFVSYESETLLKAAIADDITHIQELKLCLPE